ncbi:3-phosphoserine/phosphohydroxythreonine transaminase [Haliangium sp.]|uniref:3-phosphoserine/phosphohydroxythreonine transaminase n=1 Tax=Haliangium sp. TaxID=2663208 RepID=UPI003D0B64E4
MSDRIYNFSSGPAVLPEPVLRRAQGALWDLNGTGIGAMEHSHRSPAFTAVIERAEASLRSLAGIPDDYRVLFLTGGASTQFFMVPMNLLGDGRAADYVNTGVWSKKAIKEARRFGPVHVAASSEDEDFSYIPERVHLSEGPAYLHITSNNTIYGTEFTREPELPATVPLICDASSDILSRPIDVSRYGLIYAGAQKNLGPAGVTVVIIRDDLVEAGRDDLPTMLQYRTHADAGSRFNTPPTFAVYVLAEVLAWIEDQGGLTAMAEHNQAKAQLIYDALDRSELFRTMARPDSRSRMNICFRTPSPELDVRFAAEAEQRGLSGLKGHRSVGGMRASIYNAFPPAGCRALVDFMDEFERAHG